MAMNIFQKWFSMDIGVDLGTATTLVYVKGEGIVLTEPSVVAVDRSTHEVLAVGTDAKQMLGRTPGNIVAIRPMKDGVISDFDIVQEMLRAFIKRVKNRSRNIFHPRLRIVVGVPSGITEVEKRAVRESAHQAGAWKVYMVEEPMAAAIGAGMPVTEPTGNMIIDIGGGTTEVAIISLGGIVVSKSVRVAGDEFDMAISQHIKRKYNLMIGERTSEDIKIQIGSAYPLQDEKSMIIKGRDLITGLPRSIEIDSVEIREALLEPVQAIVDAVKSTLEKAPPELAADIVDAGITMAGGSSQLRGLDSLISDETKLTVRLADNPTTAVALGTGKCLDSIAILARYEYTKR
jgi:rod shape-determining protein MreB